MNDRSSSPLRNSREKRRKEKSISPSHRHEDLSRNGSDKERSSRFKINDRSPSVEKTRYRHEKERHTREKSFSNVDKKQRERSESRDAKKRHSSERRSVTKERSTKRPREEDDAFWDSKWEASEIQKKADEKVSCLIGQFISGQ